MSQLLGSGLKSSLIFACNVSHCLKDAMLLLLVDSWINRMEQKSTRTVPWQGCAEVV